MPFDINCIAYEMDGQEQDLDQLESVQDEIEGGNEEFDDPEDRNQVNLDLLVSYALREHIENAEMQQEIIQEPEAKIYTEQWFSSQLLSVSQNLRRSLSERDLEKVSSE